MYHDGLYQAENVSLIELKSGFVYDCILWNE